MELSLIRLSPGLWRIERIVGEDTGAGKGIGGERRRRWSERVGGEVREILSFLLIELLWIIRYIIYSDVLEMPPLRG